MSRVSLLQVDLEAPRKATVQAERVSAAHRIAINRGPSFKTTSRNDVNVRIACLSIKEEPWRITARWSAIASGSAD